MIVAIEPQLYREDIRRKDNLAQENKKCVVVVFQCIVLVSLRYLIQLIIPFVQVLVFTMIIVLIER